MQDNRTRDPEETKEDPVEARVEALLQQMGENTAGIQELASKAVALQEGLAQAQQENAALQQQVVEAGYFAAMAAHDLNTPLTVVVANLQLTLVEPDNESIRGQVRQALDAARRMEEIIRDLMAFAKTGSGVKEFKPVDGEIILSVALGNSVLEINESGAVVTHDLLPTVTGDMSQLARVFQNLIGNAIKFRGKEPPRVHISRSHEGGEWVFSVSDNGIGVPAERAEHVFEMFAQLNKGEYPGAGIGLATCKKIVEGHGGKIWVESEGVGRGSTFYFTIPSQDYP